ncbi:hypothetical protein B0H13DRAFT_2059960, partial [Mycena leptocephala]
MLSAWTWMPSSPSCRPCPRSPRPSPCPPYRAPRSPPCPSSTTASSTTAMHTRPTGSKRKSRAQPPPTRSCARISEESSLGMRTCRWSGAIIRGLCKGIDSSPSRAGPPSPVPSSRCTTSHSIFTRILCRWFCGGRRFGGWGAVIPQTARPVARGAGRVGAEVG